MLKSANSKDCNDICSFLGSGIIPLRIISYIKAYGFDKDFVKFWISTEKGRVNGVIALFEETVLVHVDDTADLSEVKTFLSMLPYKNLSCEEEVANLLGFIDFSVKQGYIFQGEPSDYEASDIGESDIRKAYELISESIPDSFNQSKEAYLSFLSDYTYRKRRGLARGKCLIENGEFISCVVTSAETESDALLSGVATDKNVRKGGYGKRTVLSLVNELFREGKTAYVIALNDSAKGFYEHIGFEKNKTIAYINRKD